MKIANAMKNDFKRRTFGNKRYQQIVPKLLEGVVS